MERRVIVLRLSTMMENMLPMMPIMHMHTPSTARTRVSVVIAFTLSFFISLMKSNTLSMSMASEAFTKDVFANDMFANSMLVVRFGVTKRWESIYIYIYVCVIVYLVGWVSGMGGVDDLRIVFVCVCVCIFLVE